jgi:hypothetical protein
MMAPRDENRHLRRAVETAKIGTMRSEEQAMKQFISISVIALALMAGAASAQSSTPPPLPALTQQQRQEVDARIDAYRRITDERVARGEVTADEAARLVQWREWQIARQTLAQAAIPPDYREAPLADASRPPDYREPPVAYDAAEPPSGYVPYRYATPYYATPYYAAPYYGPYYGPYYRGPRPYAYWGPSVSVCAGGFGRNFGGRICF